MTIKTYLLSSVFRSPDEPAAAAAAAGPGAPAAGASESAPAAAAAAPDAAAASSKAEGAAPAAAESAAPAADGAAAPDAKPESTPSLLEAASTKPPAKEGEKPAEAAAAPKDGAKEGDKPADGAKPATEAKPDKDAKAAERPADAKADKAGDGKAAPAEEALAAKPQARSYEAFKVPEGAKLDDKQVKGFTDVLEAADLGHQDRAQKLIDMHVAEMQRVVQEQQTLQRKVWTDYNDQLKTELKSDPELGGNRADTVLGQAKAVVEQFGGNEQQIADTLKMMSHTGMGNYIGLTRLLNNVYEKLVAPKIVPGSPPSRGGSRRSFQDVAYGDTGANGAAS